MGSPSVADWALANPAGRDALLALAERAVALQPAAEAAIQHCRAGPAEPAEPGQDARLVWDAYRSLREHLAALEVEAGIAGELGELLDRHLEALDGALGGPAAGTAAPGAATVPEGLGRAAGRLVGLRDLLRRTVAVGGRPVTDVTPGV